MLDVIDMANGCVLIREHWVGRNAQEIWQVNVLRLSGDWVAIEKVESAQTAWGRGALWCDN